ncbi:hypothetical protein GCM10009576_015450 [Streptomyces rhizosphaericus]|uniref:Uncharacterized protein n=1 Tax=Streptomyces rhizosphaericus TaxID=114699 RepID=A0ABN1S4J9_9ACTN
MRRPGGAAYGLSLAWWFFQGGRLDRADRAAAYRTGQPGHMVGVALIFALSMSHETFDLMLAA